MALLVIVYGVHVLIHMWWKVKEPPRIFCLVCAVEGEKPLGSSIKDALAAFQVWLCQLGGHIWGYSNSKSKRHLCWLVIGSSTYYLYAFVASILDALISSLIWNRNYISTRYNSKFLSIPAHRTFVVGHWDM
jgi:hypothetical protein